MSTLASPNMVLEHLKGMFGDDPQFTLEIAAKMKEVMIEDLKTNCKEEYMSEMGLAVLFDRSGGAITETMRDVIDKVEVQQVRHKELLEKVRAMWDTWDLQEDSELQGDECLEFDSFYNGFMAPFFGCFRCDDTRKGLSAIDMDKLLSVTFRKAIIPAMRDEILE